jgi:hypothetical protein
MKYLIAALFLLLLPLTAMADELKSKNDIKALSKNVMEKVARGETFEGMKLLKPHFVIPPSEFEVMIEQYKLQAPVIKQRFGETVGIELIAEKEIGESLMMIHYIQKFEKAVMSWKFYFYKPKNNWVVPTFFTDDKIQELFK